MRMLFAVAAATALWSAGACAHQETITIDGCAKVETEMQNGGGPPTMTVRCKGETGGPVVRNELLFSPGSGDINIGPLFTTPNNTR